MSSSTPVGLVPTFVVMDPLRLKEEIRDPAFRALLEQGYTVATPVVLEDLNPETNKVFHRIGFVMAPPVTPPDMSLPAGARAWAYSVVGLLGAMTCLLAWLALR